MAKSFFVFKKVRERGRERVAGAHAGSVPDWGSPHDAPDLRIGVRADSRRQIASERGVGAARDAGADALPVRAAAGELRGTVPGVPGGRGGCAPADAAAQRARQGARPRAPAVAEPQDLAALVAPRVPRCPRRVALEALQEDSQKRKMSLHWLDDVSTLLC